MTREEIDAVKQAIADAEEFAEGPAISTHEKPRLLVVPADPDQTVARLRDVLASADGLYERTVPVRLVFDQLQEGVCAQVLSPYLLILRTHAVCRPYRIMHRSDGTIEEKDTPLPHAIANMYLDSRDWRLPVLKGIASGPLLRDDGTFQLAEGYDPQTCLWQESVPDISGLVPEHPNLEEAVEALLSLRETFKTFCFADGAIIDEDGLQVVDTGKPPGKDESALLAALLTAVCRASLDRAPGLLLRASPMSGAGAGKGLLARCICLIAFGREPHAVTGGSTGEELDKRIAAELIAGHSALFLDNLNNMAVKSDLLASILTERLARVRLLGKSENVPLHANAFVILTGNGLTVTEDLARRFIFVELDARTEAPEFSIIQK